MKASDDSLARADISTNTHDTAKTADNNNLTDEERINHTTFLLKKQLGKMIKCFDELPDKTSTEKDIYFKSKDCLSANDLIITQCQHDGYEVLNSLLHETIFIHALNNPNATDEEIDQQRTTAFRYAILSKTKPSRMIEMLYDFWCSKIHWTGYSTDDNKTNIIENIKRVGQSLNNARKDCEIYLREAGQNILSSNIHSLCKFNKFQVELYIKLQAFNNQRSEASSSNNEADNDIPTETDDVKNKVTAMRDLIRIVLSTYIEYSHMDKILPTIEKNQIRECPFNGQSIYYKSEAYIKYEMYFRKIDFNVTLLILDNLDFLKKHLKAPGETYQELECIIYHFIYRTKENWTFYLPKNGLTLITIYQPYKYWSQILSNYKITLKLNFEKFNCCSDNAVHLRRLENGIILYLERKRYEECLQKFKKIIDEVEINNNIVVKPIPSSLHCLTLLPYMRNENTLKNIIHIVETAVNYKEEVFGEKKVLLIETAIKTIGEMLKSTEATFHMSHTTKALIQAELSVQTIKNLNELRNYICHTNYKGQITINTRIDIANNDINKYEKILKDLIRISDCLKNIQNIYKPLCDKSQIETGISLINERLIEVSTIYNDDLLESEIWKIFQPDAEPLCEEMSQLIKVRESLAKEKYVIEVQINYVVTKKINKYISAMKDITMTMKNMNEKWNKLKFQLEQLNVKIHKFLSVNPNIDNINKIIRKLEVQLNTNDNIKYFYDNLKEINDIKDNAVAMKNNNEKLKNVKLQHEKLNFKVEAHKFIADNLNKDNIQNIIRKLEVQLSNDNTHIVDRLKKIKDTKDIAVVMKNNNEELNNIQFKIKKLDDKIKVHTFISENANQNKLNNMIRKLEVELNNNVHIKYLVDDLKDIKDFSADWQHIKMLSLFCVKEFAGFGCYVNRINEDSTYSTANIDTVLEIIGSLEIAADCSHPACRIGDTILLVKEFDQNSQASTSNVAEEYPFHGIKGFLGAFEANNNKGYDAAERNKVIVSCLKNRIHLLNKQIQGSDKNFADLVMKYKKRINGFHIIINMLVEDILNILHTCGLTHLTKKPTKLLAGCNVRNMLAHGNPFLDTIGKMLDDEDFATEIISKAILILNDQKVKKLVE